MLFDEFRILFFVRWRVLEIDGGKDEVIVWMYLLLLGCEFINVKIVKCVFILL